MTFESPSGQRFNVLLSFPESLVSGTATDGIYEYTATIPQYSETGDWSIERGWLRDQLANAVAFGRDEVAALGLPTTITVGATPCADPNRCAYPYPHTYAHPDPDCYTYTRAGGCTDNHACGYCYCRCDRG
jgi:hypothetical protein